MSNKAQTKATNTAEEVKNNKAIVQSQVVAPEKAKSEPEVETEFKVAIINFSGNVGKTTLKRFLLEPRMNLDAVYTIETLSKDGNEGEGDIIVTGGDFEDIQRALLELDSVLVDIGVTNVEATMRYLNRIEGSHEDFDYFIVPVVKMVKPLKNSVATIHSLLKMGVEPERIKVVFNMVEDPDKIEVHFEDLIFALEEFGVPYDTENAVTYTEFYPNFDNLGVSLEELLSTKVEENTKELKALRGKAKKNGGLSAEEEDRRDALIELITTQRYAKTAVRNLDRVYTSLFKI